MSDNSIRWSAEIAVCRWSRLLKEEGVTHGEIAYGDELIDIIEQTFNEREERINVSTKKTVNKETNNKNSE